MDGWKSNSTSRKLATEAVCQAPCKEVTYEEVISGLLSRGKIHPSLPWV